jgi:hypothetical protein
LTKQRRWPLRTTRVREIDPPPTSLTESSAAALSPSAPSQRAQGGVEIGVEDLMAGDHSAPGQGWVEWLRRMRLATRVAPEVGTRRALVGSRQRRTGFTDAGEYGLIRTPRRRAAAPTVGRRAARALPVGEARPGRSPAGVPPTSSNPGVKAMKIRLILVSALLAIGLAGCGEDAKKAEAAKAEAARLAAEAKQKADEAAKKAGEAVGAAAEATKEAGKEAVAATKEAGKEMVVKAADATKDAADATKDAADKAKAAVGK